MVKRKKRCCQSHLHIHHTTEIRETAWDNSLQYSLALCGWCVLLKNCKRGDVGNLGFAHIIHPRSPKIIRVHLSSCVIAGNKVNSTLCIYFDVWGNTRAYKEQELEEGPFWRHKCSECRREKAPLLWSLSVRKNVWSSPGAYVTTSVPCAGEMRSAARCLILHRCFFQSRYTTCLRSPHCLISKFH